LPSWSQPLNWFANQNRAGRKPRELTGNDMTNAYQGAYERSLNDPEGFWADAAQEIDWYKTWDKVLDDSQAPFYRWFAGAECNTCYNALDRHVTAGRADQPALIYDSPVTGTVKTYSYAELLDQVARFAGVLAGLGVSKGDRVIVYMPMVPEAAIAMLACARLGAIHSVVFGGFAANELAVRIDDAKPKAIVSASCGIEVNRVIEYMPLLNAAIDIATHKPDHCVILARPEAEAALTPGRDVDWASAVADAQPADCVPVAATDPLYILYTSGTTGQPKGVVRDNGGHMVALKWSMKNIYDVDPGDVYWAASDVGWVVGHSYIVYAPLLHGCTTILYEGKPVGTPDAGAFWRVIEQHKVKCLFTAPTAFRAIKREDPDGKLLADYDMRHYKTLFLAGERLDPDTLHWAEDKLMVPVIDHWWQTETGWPIASNCLGLHHFPIKPGSPTKAVPGWDVQALDDAGHPVAAGDVGAADALAEGRAVQGKVPGRVPGLLLHRRRRHDRRRRLHLHHGAHRRHHQRGRPPIVDRRHGGSAGRTPGRRRMRRHRRRGPTQGPVAGGFPGAQRRCHQVGGRGRRRGGEDGQGPHRRRCRVQAGRGRGTVAEDAVRQDPARHHAEDRRRARVQGAGDHRRSRHPRRDRRGAAANRLFQGAHGLARGGEIEADHQVLQWRVFAVQR
jgi:acyl-coenzyme A synthetase/AMP-(fatty) acid ligase